MRSHVFLPLSIWLPVIAVFISLYLEEVRKKFFYRVISGVILSVLDFVVMMRASVIYLLFLLQFVAFVPVLLAGKSKDKSVVRKRPIARGSSTSSNSTNATRYLLDWQNTSLESLRLACNALNVISSGSRAAIARRLITIRPIRSITRCPLLLPS